MSPRGQNPDIKRWERTCFNIVDWLNFNVNDWMNEHAIAQELPHYCVSQCVAFQCRIPGDETLVKCSRTIFYSVTTPRTQSSEYDKGRCLSTSSTESSSLVMICWMIEWMNQWTMRRRDCWRGENGYASLSVNAMSSAGSFHRKTGEYTAGIGRSAGRMELHRAKRGHSTRRAPLNSTHPWPRGLCWGTYSKQGTRVES